MPFIVFDQNSGVILNSIVVDEHTINSGWQPPAGQTMVEFNGAFDIGWVWDGSKAINPNPPPSVTIAATKVL